MRTLIVAPHPDDELIGCYSILKDSTRRTDVLVLNDLTPERIKELQACSKAYNFNILDAKSVNANLQIKAYQEVYVPSRNDWHAEHKKANREYLEYATHYYSVDMVNGKPLPLKDRLGKQNALNTLYPSQSALWLKDEKYFLFEAVHTVDCEEYELINLGDLGTVTVLTCYAERVKNIPMDSRFEVEVLKVCERGKVVFQQGCRIKEFK